MLSDAWSWWWESTNSSDEFARVSLTFALISLVISWYAWMFIKNRGGAPPPPPGPRGLPLLGYLPFLDPELHSHFADLARAHGPILKLRLGSKVGIVVTSPSLAREVLKDHDTIFANRDVPDLTNALQYGGFDIVCTVRSGQSGGC
ncbi:Angelicin synthase [Vitis vinifera]|uniref:Angelicin synthase n=1 Tax=Vitis vinifera TaxID=29760 RepID=A0A438ESU2_VITVI|nr:Angelicin synthase [Vitis vinifera]